MDVILFWGQEGLSMSQPGFFDFDECLASLSKASDPLEGLAHTVDFEIFRRPLDNARKYSDRKKGGVARLTILF